MDKDSHCVKADPCDEGYVSVVPSDMPNTLDQGESLRITDSSSGAVLSSGTEPTRTNSDSDEPLSMASTEAVCSTQDQTQAEVRAQC